MINRAPKIEKPHRIQRKRTKGWRMPPNTIYVGRPSQWGNPFKMEPWTNPTDGRVVDARTNAMLKFSMKVFLLKKLLPQAYEAYIAPLRGKNLACWCPLSKPCHADILLGEANK